MQESIEIGKIINGREVIAKERESGRWMWQMKCLTCGNIQAVRESHILEGRVCICKRHDKAKETIKANPEKNRIGQEKARQTNLERYGASNPLASKQCRDKGKETMLALYGVENPSRNPDSRDKAVRTNLARYGVACVLTKGEIRDRAKDTLRKRYGVSHALQNDELASKALASRLETMKDGQFRSREEVAIQEYVESLGVICSHHSSGRFEVDVFSPCQRIGIEYNGLYWHSERHKNKTAHLDKLLHYKKLGVSIIQIWEHQWLNRQEQVKSFLRSKFGKNSNRVGVRKCCVRLIDKALAVAFLEAYHIQGANKQLEFAYGAYLGDELLAVAAFGKHHRGKEVTVLNRLCTKTDWTCSGFLGKVIRLAYAKVEAPIVTWVDRCWSEGESYLAAGFKKEAVLPPDYFYMKSGGTKIIRKQSFRKIDGRTEAERAKDEGLLKVWDCGKIRLTYGD